MRFGIVVFPGSNCDKDCFYVLNDVLKQDVEFIWHRESSLKCFDCIVLPGGFSYGDYLRSGAVAGLSPIMKAVIDFAKKGGLVLGICNGFQILLESGLLPGAMLKNRETRFICKYVYLKTENSSLPFTGFRPDSRVLKIPIAHNDGNYYIDSLGLKELQRNNQIVFRYCDRGGLVSEASNPNGSVENIAGIVNRDGNVLGLMPHPERSSEKALGSEDGLLIFKSIIAQSKRGHFA
ncbi:MAG: phosphoribosylformylglycinamidine synthase subunit PurQ [Candidatus Omnitrophica bacterium]|nr:phosphoribosylformylglycinamidine synthase subunit PurQ [Candidatus Omnitrophota bacterium]